MLSVRVTCSAYVPGAVGETTTTTTTTLPTVDTIPLEGGITTGTDLIPPISTTTTTIYNAFSPTVTVPIAGSGGTSVRCDRETGSVRGRGKSDPPQVGLLNDDALSRAIVVGDQVITAGGTESLAPPNLPVGKVSRVVQRRGDAPVVEVKLNADLVHLNFVEVLLYLPVSEVGG